MKVSPARLASLRILLRVENDQAWASNLLQSSSLEGLSHEDRGLAYELCLGVLRWQSRLDYLISRTSGRDPAKLDGPVRMILRMGVYQLLFLDRIPEHAVVNESVTLTKIEKKTSASGFVNAILRKLIREIPDAQVFCEIADPVVRLATETAHPEWLIKRWVARYGEDEARALALANDLPPGTTFRFVPEFETQARDWFARQGIDPSPSEFVPGAWTTEAISGSSLPATSRWIYLQDVASQGVGVVTSARLKPNAAVLDMCAAPGSKTSLIASHAPSGTLIVAAEIHAARIELLRQLLSSQPDVAVVCLDASRKLPFSSDTFDRILLDAPCSGLGTLQRHPEIKWRLRESGLAELPSLQRRLISNAGQVLKPGGAIVYSVCSTEPEEGEAIVDGFLAHYPDFTSITADFCLEAGINTSLLTPAGPGLRTFPHKNHCEGFFLAVLQRNH